jgi:hypothetical protein
MLKLRLFAALTIAFALAAQAQQMHPSAFTATSNAAAPTSLGFTFLSPKTYDSGGQLAWKVVVADVNGDGKPDVLVLNDNGESGSGDGSVGVLLGNGNGSFRKIVIYDSGGVYATGIAVGDLNGDGKLDLVVANQVCPSTRVNCLGVLLGNGDGTFKPAVTYPDGGIETFSAGGLFVPVMISDIDGDSRPDLVVVSETDPDYGDGRVGVLLGNGDGTFKAVVTYDSGGFAPFSAALADLNGDGKPDMVVFNCSPSGSSDCSQNGTVGVMLGNGDGTFQSVTKYDSGGLGGTSALVIADVNGDGRPDILVGNNCPGNCTGIGSFGVLMGKGDGTFQAAIAYPLSGVGGVESITVGDLNGDGKPDLAIVGNGVDAYLNKGDGTFRLASANPTTGNTQQVFLTDLDGDGKLDIVDINITSGTADARLGNGDGTFQSLQTFKLGGNQISWGTIADVNGDGRPDLVSANWCSSSCQSEEGAVGVLLNVASSPNSTSTTLTSSLNPSNYGQKVTFTAAVTNSIGTIPTGQVTFSWSGHTLGSANLNGSGIATLTKSNLTPGSYPVTAVYKGDTNNLGSTSSIVNQVVQQATISATLTSSPNPSTQGQAVKFTATLTSNGGLPTGQTVTFSYEGKALGSGTIGSGGKASLTITTLSVGSDVIIATYAGDTNHSSATASVTQVVN